MIDTGVGIKEEDIPKLFKLFGFVKQEDASINKNGIGLGLVIADLIVQQFGGKIEVSSKFGLGTIFKFYFETVPILKLKIPKEAFCSSRTNLDD